MTQSRLRSAVSLSVALLSSVLFLGCPSSGVGDPCLPENIPPGGFVDSEDFLETNSVQCRTRVCIVHAFQGDPALNQELCDPSNPSRPAACDDPTMRPAAEDFDNIHCTCRCRAPEGSSTPTCKCPNGFECTDVLNTGGTGIAGGYCVREDETAAP